MSYDSYLGTHPNNNNNNSAPTAMMNSNTNSSSIDFLVDTNYAQQTVGSENSVYLQYLTNLGLSQPLTLPTILSLLEGARGSDSHNGTSSGAVGTNSPDTRTSPAQSSTLPLFSLALPSPGDTAGLTAVAPGFPPLSSAQLSVFEGTTALTSADVKPKVKSRPRVSSVVPPHGSAKLFVGQIPNDITEKDLEFIFSFYGRVTEVKIHSNDGSSPCSPLSSKKNAQGGKAGSAGGGANVLNTVYAFVTYSDMIEADVAIAALHGKYVLTTTLFSEQSLFTKYSPTTVMTATATREENEGGADRALTTALPVLSRRALHRLRRMERPIQVSYAKVTTNLSLYGYQHAMALHESKSANPLPMKPRGRPTHYSWKRDLKVRFLDTPAME